MKEVDLQGWNTSSKVHYAELVHTRDSAEER